MLKNDQIEIRTNILERAVRPAVFVDIFLVDRDKLRDFVESADC